MVDFEEMGRAMNREAEKLRVFFETELKPGARRGAIEMLRTTAARLEELARDLERGSRESGSGGG
jgi:hypothetical protein